MKIKLKVMYEKPEVSDAELEKFMDFDQLLAKRAVFIKRKKIQHVIVGTSAVLVIALVSWWMLLPNEELQKSTRQELVKKRVEPTLDELITVDSTADNPPSEQEKPERTIAIKERTEPVAEKPLQKKQYEGTPEPVYIQSAPADGYANLYSYFEHELTYPKEAITDSIQGTVTVHCIIGKDGKPKNIQIENSLGELFDKEVIRIVENMPAWVPATLDGSPMDSKISLPLSFKLKSTNHD